MSVTNPTIQRAELLEALAKTSEALASSEGWQRWPVRSAFRRYWLQNQLQDRAASVGLPASLLVQEMAAAGTLLPAVAGAAAALGDPGKVRISEMHVETTTGSRRGSCSASRSGGEGWRRRQSQSDPWAAGPHAGARGNPQVISPTKSRSRIDRLLQRRRPSARDMRDTRTLTGS